MKIEIYVDIWPGSGIFVHNSRPAYAKSENAKRYKITAHIPDEEIYECDGEVDASSVERVG